MENRLAWLLALLMCGPLRIPIYTNVYQYIKYNFKGIPTHISAYTDTEMQYIKLAPQAQGAGGKNARWEAGELSRT